jgi:tRNA modification GTPase
MYQLSQDTICGISTPPGTGGIAVIRISGPGTFGAMEEILQAGKGKKVSVSALKPRTLMRVQIMDGDYILDEALLTIFPGPKSFTGEDVAELSVHGSRYIQQQTLMLLQRKGCRIAEPGEFTFRGFMNRKFDLSQAEAIADLVDSSSATAHQIAMQQMRGGFSSKIKVLREHLLDFASLLELELDFSEEDVEFADRKDLGNLLQKVRTIVVRLVESFEVGNVIKNGIPVVIAGKPNVGKSTLLNALLDEERAIVSEIPGTTRDTIEDEIVIDGILFRFIDTAGIRQTVDVIENIGVERTFEKIKQSSIVIYLFDIHEITATELRGILNEINKHNKNAHLFVVGNKIDKEDEEYTRNEFKDFPGILFISAKERKGLDELKGELVKVFDTRALQVRETVVTNARHVQALRNALSALEKVNDGLKNNFSGEMIASDLRLALYHLGTITGEVTTDDLLQNIFSRFCIGK